MEPITQRERETRQEAAVRDLLAEVIHSIRSTKDRSKIAGEMSVHLGRKITASMLNDFTSESKVQVRFPAAWVRSFCEVTDDYRLELLLLSPRLRKLVELGERELAAQRDEHARRSLREELLAEK